MAKIKELDNNKDETGLNDEERGKRDSLKLKLASFLKAEEMTWKQKSRGK